MCYKVTQSNLFSHSVYSSDRSYYYGKKLYIKSSCLTNNSLLTVS